MIAICCLLVHLTIAEVTIHRVSGEPVTAPAFRLEGRELVCSGAEGAEPERIPLDDVLLIEVAGSAAPDPQDDVTVLLSDGSSLTGRLLPAENDVVGVSVPGLGDVILPLENVRAVAIGRRGERVDPSTLDRPSDADVVYRRGDGSTDFITGTLVRLGEREVTIESEDLGEVTLRTEDVLGVVVAPLEEFQGAPADAVVELVGEAILKGRLAALSDASVVLDSLVARRLEIPLHHVERIRFRSDRYTWLSDMDPVEVSETPFIGGDDDFLFHWRRDRSVTGGPLVVAGRRFGKGLGVHSRARLTYALGGRYARFKANVGVSDEVLSHRLQGSLTVTVSVDGEARYESGPLRPGEPAVPLDIDVSGADRLEIVVGFGERGDIGDRAVIGDAMLISAD